MAIQSVNPATGRKIRTWKRTTPEQLERILERSQRAFLKWRRTPYFERAKFMMRAASLLRNHEQACAELMAEEMGKPVLQGRKEAEKCAWVCEYYAGNAEKFLRPERIKTDAAKSYAAFQPLGVLLAIMPWNFPFWQVFRAAAPAIMAGNTIVLKHASNVSGCACSIEKIFSEAGFPDAVFNSLYIETPAVSSVIAHPAVRAVTITGSVSAGGIVAAKAGSCLKKTVLELGGSDPYLILEDADLERAVSACGESRLINSGQSCIAAKRFIVAEKVHDQFVEGLVKYMRLQKVGDPMQEDTTVGPLARKDLRDAVHRQVIESVDKGAKLVLGGKIPRGAGWYYPPTVLTRVRPGMPAFDEELFGPVAAVVKVKTEAQAVSTANDSVFGLGAAVFTRDVKKGEQLACEELNAGCAFVNAYVKSDPRLPFGGIGQSGYGRELGIFGIREFVNIKTVYVGGKPVGKT